MKFDARRNFLSALLVAVAAAGCQSFPYFVGLNQGSVNQNAPPVSQLAAPDETHASQWEAGRAIYIGGCASCHKPKSIQEFAIDEWKDRIIPGHVGEGQASARKNAITRGVRDGRQALAIAWQRACQSETGDRTDIGGR